MLWSDSSQSYLKGVFLVLPVAGLISLFWYVVVRRRAPKRLRVSPKAIFIEMLDGTVFSCSIREVCIRQYFGKIYIMVGNERFRLFPDLENLALLEELLLSSGKTPSAGSRGVSAVLRKK